MKGIISFSGAFELQYEVKFMQARIKHILDDMMSLHYLATRSRSSYLLYTRLARILSRNGEVLLLLKRVKIEAEGCKDLWASYLD